MRVFFTICLLCLVLCPGAAAAEPEIPGLDQLWETAHESYVQDVLTANRLYSDICKEAGIEQTKDCIVVFVGERGIRLSESAVTGDAIGYSFFEWDVDSVTGVNGRVHTRFETLGLEMEKP